MKVSTNILRAATLFQAKDDVRFYLNAVAITSKHVVATDGCAAVMMEHGQKFRASCVIVRFAHKIPAKAATTKIHLLGKKSYAEHFDALGLPVSIGIVEIIQSKYPDVSKVMSKAYAGDNKGNERFALQSKYLSLIDKAFGGRREFCHVSIKGNGSDGVAAIEFHNESINSSFGNPMVCIMPAKI